VSVGTFVVPDLPEGSRVVVYGAGGYGRWVAQMAASNGLHVVDVVDRDPTSCSWTSAVSLAEAARNHPGTTTVVGVFSPGPDIVEVASAITSSGLGPVVTPPQFFSWLARNGERARLYWLTTDTTRYGSDANAIETALSLMSDAESRHVFASLLAYRTTGDPAQCPRPRPLAEQHTGIDFGFLPTRSSLVVDCGAYVGDTFANWEAAGLQHDLVLALEPDDDSFSKMVRTAALSQLRVVPVPAGVAERTGRYRVEGAGASASLVPAADGGTVALSLDDLVGGAGVSLIKMDIEGGEAAALRGATSALRADRPHLAVSVYHKPWHLWTIVNWINEVVGGYRFHLRVYGHQGYDTVLYAVPT
jgi:FkbM family methyltransferase